MLPKHRVRIRIPTVRSSPDLWQLELAYSGSMDSITCWVCFTSKLYQFDVQWLQILVVHTDLMMAVSAGSYIFCKCWHICWPHHAKVTRSYECMFQLAHVIAACTDSYAKLDMHQILAYTIAVCANPYTSWSHKTICWLQIHNPKYWTRCLLEVQAMCWQEWCTTPAFQHTINAMQNSDPKGLQRKLSGCIQSIYFTVH